MRGMLFKEEVREKILLSKERKDRERRIEKIEN